MGSAKGASGDAKSSLVVEDKFVLSSEESLGASGVGDSKTSSPSGCMLSDEGERLEWMVVAFKKISKYVLMI
jgi:hypothetical protein